jgi:hypothetical protein
MNDNSRLKIILQAFLGVIFLATYFWLFSHSKIETLVRLQAPKSEILAQAEKTFNESPAGEYDLEREVGVGLDDDLAYYAQTHLKTDSARAVLPIGKMKFSTKTRRGKDLSAPSMAGLTWRAKR